MTRHRRAFRSAPLGLVLVALLQVTLGGFGAWAHLRTDAPAASSGTAEAGPTLHAGTSHTPSGGFAEHPADCAACQHLGHDLAPLADEGRAPAFTLVADVPPPVVLPAAAERAATLPLARGPPAFA